MPVMMLISESASAPPASAAFAISVMSVTFGVSFMETGCAAFFFISFVMYSTIPGFYNPTAFIIPLAVSMILGVGFPSHGTHEMNLAQPLGGGGEKGANRLAQYETNYRVPKKTGNRNG